MDKTVLFTIGFTKKSAEAFFEKLVEAGVKKIIDIRLNNISQLAGFTKKNDLIYLLRKICDCGYTHKPLLAPTKEILDNYKKGKIGWPEYEKRFNDLLLARKVHTFVNTTELHMACLLCSEPTPDRCHRRLVAEYLKSQFENIEVKHL
ncbi:MAG: hypothetical protein ILNGONEN_01207 [Syntrophorhabdaceae bacterium]|jgi:uncharacterized protein (DUF488 family)|nr:hypothetical protein [Syntrophorhabdaceae bacterium]MDI9560542.1 DUF488 domain-containing protein [Pseudomonadota bacterium]